MKYQNVAQCSAAIEAIEEKLAVVNIDAAVEQANKQKAAKPAQKAAKPAQEAKDASNPQKPQ